MVLQCCPRSRQIERPPKCAYDGEPPIDPLMSGLARVASALNANDQCWRGSPRSIRRRPICECRGRDALAAKSADRDGRDGGAANRGSGAASRTGAPPNPAWFAPTGGASHDTPRVRVAENDDPTRRSDASSGAVDNWSHLPPAKRSMNSSIFWTGGQCQAGGRTDNPRGNQSLLGERRRYAVVGILNYMLSQVLKPGTTGTNGSKYSSSSTTIPVRSGRSRAIRRSALRSVRPAWSRAVFPAFSEAAAFRAISSRQRRDWHPLQSSVPLYGNLGHGREEKQLHKIFAAVRYMRIPNHRRLRRRQRDEQQSVDLNAAVDRTPEPHRPG